MKIVVIAGLADSLINFRGPLLTALAERGHRVIGCAPEDNPALQKRLRSIGVDYHAIAMDRTGLNPVEDIRYFFQLKAMLKQANPDMVLAYTVKPVIYGSLAARMAGVPRIFSIITGLGYSFMGETFKQRAVNKIVSRLYRLGLAANDKVFFQNPDDLALFCGQHLISSREKGVLINGSGVDLDYFAPPHPSCMSPAFLLIARLLKDKGIGEYVEAAGILKKRYPHAIFRLLGPFDSNPAGIGAASIRQWKNEGLIEYLGETDDVRPFLSEASVYVLPSYREGTPRSVLEAMAMGRPIVTTDAPGCRETVVDGDNGFLVPIRDSPALAAAMEKFLVDPGLIVKMGKRSREIAEEKYDVRKVNAVIMKTMGLLDEKGF